MLLLSGIRVQGKYKHVPLSKADNAPTGRPAILFIYYDCKIFYGDLPNHYAYFNIDFQEIAHGSAFKFSFPLANIYVC